MKNQDSFADFTRAKSPEDELSGDLFHSFAYTTILDTVSEETTNSEIYTLKKHHVASSMRVERYYSSIKEEVSPLTESAEELLSTQDYVGFFMACGSNYIRSIRRAQEVVSIFTFSTNNQKMAQEFARGLKASGFGATIGREITKKTKFEAIASTLEINVFGYGIGLNPQGEGTLIAYSVDEYNDLTKFAYRAMTQNEGGSLNIGMVHTIEVVPWVDNVSFQVASKIHDEAIEVPLPRSVVPRAYYNGTSTDASEKDFDVTRINEFQCKDPSYVVDKFGYCCEQGALFNAVTEEYNTDINQTEAICRPLRNLDRSILKNNMASNGEFVCRLDSALRSKLNEISTLENCVSAVRSIPEALDYNYLKPQGVGRFDPNVTRAFTVKELKIALDPFNDYGLVKHMTKEMDEFMDMFYQPCLKALFGGRDEDYDSVNFLLDTWNSHEECLLMSCLSDTVRWDRREGGGCVSSLLSGVDAHGYGEPSDEKGCAFDGELADETETCKYPLDELRTDHQRYTQCWRNTLEQVEVDYIIEQFCLPQISGQVADESFQVTLNDKIENYCS